MKHFLVTKFFLHKLSLGVPIVNDVTFLSKNFSIVNDDEFDDEFFDRQIPIVNDVTFLSKNGMNRRFDCELTTPSKYRHL